MPHETDSRSTVTLCRISASENGWMMTLSAVMDGQIQNIIRQPGTILVHIPVQFVSKSSVQEEHVVVFRLSSLCMSHFCLDRVKQ